ncbi:MAG: LytTR family DNA-binding domain-containing protein [Marinifilum sp.]|jgi:two-component system LytT family response regulator|nr:LytTR family DNA-binding domain-containing protein [Marinifilum sp.]
MKHTTSYSTLIVDDEPKSQVLLLDLLVGFDCIDVKAIADSVDEAVTICRRIFPELIFLDIEMPGKNGFDLITELNLLNQNPTIIFITAYNQYAIKAFKYSAFDYLLKPVQVKDLENTIARLNNRATNSFHGSVKLLKEYLSQEKIVIDIRTGYLNIIPDELVYCEADGNYTTIHLFDGRTETVCYNLKNIENQLKNLNLCRVSRSLLVNPKHVYKVNCKEKLLQLSVNGGCKSFKVPLAKLRNLNQILANEI